MTATVDPVAKGRIYAYCEALGIETHAARRDYSDPSCWDLGTPALEPLKQFLVGLQRSERRDLASPRTVPPQPPVRKKLIEVASAPRRHQRRVGAGEVDPARAPQHPAPVVGAPAPGRGAGGDLRADGGRSLPGTWRNCCRILRSEVRRSGPLTSGFRRAGMGPHRRRNPHSPRPSPGRSATGCFASSRNWSAGRTRPTRSCWNRRVRRSARAGGEPASTMPVIPVPPSCSTPTTAPGLPRSLRGRRRPAAGGAAPGAGGPCQRSQPGGRAHQQGDDRDPAQVRWQAAGQPRSLGWRLVGQGVPDRARLDRGAGARRGRALLRAVDARRGGAAHRASVSRRSRSPRRWCGSGPTSSSTRAAS